MNEQYSPIRFPNERGRRINRRNKGRRVFVTNRRKSTWKSIPWLIRVAIWVTAVPILLSALVFACLLLIGIARVS